MALFDFIAKFFGGLFQRLVGLLKRPPVNGKHLFPAQVDKRLDGIGGIHVNGLQ